MTNLGDIVKRFLKFNVKCQAWFAEKRPGFFSSDPQWRCCPGKPINSEGCTEAPHQIDLEEAVCGSLNVFHCKNCRKLYCFFNDQEISEEHRKCFLKIITADAVCAVFGGIVAADVATSLQHCASSDDPSWHTIARFEMVLQGAVAAAAFPDEDEDNANTVAAVLNVPAGNVTFTQVIDHLGAARFLCHKPSLEELQTFCIERQDGAVSTHLLSIEALYLLAVGIRIYGTSDKCKRHVDGALVDPFEKLKTEKHCYRRWGNTCVCVVVSSDIMV